MVLEVVCSNLLIMNSTNFNIVATYWSSFIAIKCVLHMWFYVGHALDNDIAKDFWANLCWVVCRKGTLILTFIYIYSTKLLLAQSYINALTKIAALWNMWADIKRRHRCVEHINKPNSRVGVAALWIYAMNRNSLAISVNHAS